MRPLMWILLIAWLGACGKTSSHAPTESSVRGLGSQLVRPALRSSDELNDIAGKMLKHLDQASLTSGGRGVLKQDTIQAKQVLGKVYAKMLLESGGLPRGQGVRVLRKVLSTNPVACGGASCSRIFGLTVEGIEPFFDDLLKKVRESPSLQAADKAQERAVIEASLVRPQPEALMAEARSRSPGPLPRPVSGPPPGILSRSELEKKLDSASMAAIRTFTGDDSRLFRSVQAYSEKELAKTGYSTDLILKTRQKLAAIGSAFKNPTIPRVKTTVYRGMRYIEAEDIATYLYHQQSGAPLGLGPEHRPALTSASWDPDVADTFTNLRSVFGSDYSVILEITEHGGIGIENASMATFEREVLIPGDRFFRVESVKPAAGRHDLFVIKLTGVRAGS